MKMTIMMMMTINVRLQHKFTDSYSKIWSMANMILWRSENISISLKAHAQHCWIWSAMKKKSWTVHILVICVLFLSHEYLCVRCPSQQMLVFWVLLFPHWTCSVSLGRQRHAPLHPTPLPPSPSLTLPPSFILAPVFFLVISLQLPAL